MHISMMSVSRFVDPVRKIILASSNLKKSIQYWHETIGLKVLEKTDESAVFAFNEKEAKLELKDIGNFFF